jgi:N-acetylgalactosamine-6-sulfatase
MKQFKDIIPYSLLGAAVCAAVPGVAKNKIVDRPNILLIYFDDMGYGDLGLTGNPNIATPNLDRLGRQGVWFTNYYTPSAASTASRYGLLTGRYPSRSGFGWVLKPNSKLGIHSDELLLPEALQEAGYRTAMVGKWHLGSTDRSYYPLQNGFEEYFGLLYSNDMLPPKWPDMNLMEGNDVAEVNPSISKLTRIYSDRAISYIKRNDGTPFFLYLAYAMPHTHLDPEKPFAGRSKRGTYGDVVEELDFHVGRVIQSLKEEGLEDNTLVIITSDNGPWLIWKELGGSSGLFKDGKGSTWEGGHRVPFVVYAPRMLEPRVDPTLISGLDIFPTLLSIAGYKIDKNRVVDGMDISRLMEDPSQIKKFDNRPFFYFGLGQTLMAVREGKWKLHIKQYSQLEGAKKLYFDGKLPLLFNLDVDPSEQYDLADQYPEVVARLQKLIDEKRAEIQQTGSFWGKTICK